MSIISRIFFGKVDREMKRISRRSRIALHAIVHEENLIYRIERIFDTTKDIAEIKKEIFSVKRRFAKHMKQFTNHSSLIQETFYPHKGKLKELIEAINSETEMLELYWNNVFRSLDYEGIKNIIPIYLGILKRIRSRIKIIKEIELVLKQKVEAKEEIPPKKVA